MVANDINNGMFIIFRVGTSIARTTKHSKLKAFDSALFYKLKLNLLEKRNAMIKFL